MDLSRALQLVISKLKDTCISREKLQREDEVIIQLRNNENLMKRIHLLLEGYYDKRDLKSVDLGKSYRKKGNDRFQMKRYTESVTSYTLCALYSPPSSNELSIAYANRSACLFYLNRYNDCINDIKLALNLNYPVNWCYKIYLRAAQCYLKLGKRQLAEEMLFKVQEMINNPDYIVAAMKDHIKKKISEITLSDSSTESNEQKINGLSKIKSQIKFEENENFPNASSSIDKKYNEEVGRHVVANRMIKRGEILFLEKPVSFVSVNFDGLSDYCHHCNCLTRDVPVPCKNCLNTCYCSEECLIEAWSSYHMWECVASQMGLLKNIGIGRLALKVLLTCSTMTDTVRFNEMHSLLTHFNKVPVDDLIDYGVTALMLTIYLSKYTDFFKLPLEESLMNKFFDDPLKSVRDDKQLYVASLLLKHILQLIANAHAISSSNTLLSANMEDIVASGIYPSTSMMNHSCNPNIITIFMDQYIIIKAATDILADEEIFISYGPHFKHMEMEKRQEILKSQFHFTCKCEPCTLMKSCKSKDIERAFCLQNMDWQNKEPLINIMCAATKAHMESGRIEEGVACMDRTIAIAKGRHGFSSTKLLITLNTFADLCLEYLQISNTTNEYLQISNTNNTYKIVQKHAEEYLNEMEEMVSWNYGSWSKIYEDVKIKQEKIVPVHKTF